MATSSGKYYSPYSDMSLWNTWHNLTQISSESGIKNFTLGFVQAYQQSGQAPGIGWGGNAPVFPSDPTNPGDPNDITNQVTALQAAGAVITVSFGGEHGTDPATAVANYYGSPTINTTAFNNAVTMLAQQYQQVINVLHVDHLDFDIEGAAAVTNVSAAHIRNYAIKQLEANNPNLHISFTLPVSVTDGLPTSGYHGNVKALLDYAKQDGVQIDVVNLMTMVLGPDGGNEFLRIKAATEAAHQDVIDSGVVDSMGLSPKIGITPWIGVNTSSETFTLTDAQNLVNWAKDQAWVAGFGAWSVQHDHDSDEAGRSDPALYSGVDQTPYQFSSILNQITVGTQPPVTNQTFVGTSANQTFAGTQAGNDTVTYQANATAGVIVDLAKTTAQNVGGGMGTDTFTSIENVTGGGYADRLYGNGDVNKLIGNGGADILDGRGGADTMTGGAGDDFYYVDNVGDVIVEGSGDAADRAYISLLGQTYTLSATAQVEYLIGNAGTAGATGVSIVGNAYSHKIYGSVGNDSLTGGSGADILDGKGGVDTMTGGAGNDFYYVDNVNDVIVETANDTGDRAYISASTYTLGADAKVEMLIANAGSTGITINGNAYSHKIYGGDGADTLNGGSGADTLDGKGGADTMAGGTGNDFYYINDANDKIIETGNDTGDRAYISTASYTLGAAAQVESVYAANGANSVTINGNDYSHHIYGGAGGDFLNGGSGGDSISGGAGNDTIDGGGGRDSLTGGAGSDIFKFKAVSESTKVGNKYDVITDFQQGQDHIDLGLIDANTNTVANDAFTFLANGAAFTNHAGELRATTSNGVTLIQGDVNGDSVADLQIQLTGTYTITANDFLTL